MQAFYTGYEETVNRFTFELAFFDYIANSGECLILYRYRFVGTIINRANTRNPLRILPYEASAPQMVIEVTDTSLQLKIQQAARGLDIVRVIFQPGGQTSKVIDFESRVGLNPEDEDENPYQDIFITPQPFNKASATYELTVDYQGDWQSLTSCTVEVVSIQGTSYTKNWSSFIVLI